MKRIAPNKRQVDIGERFGRLTIVEELEQHKSHRYMLTKCDCGNIARVRLSHLVSGKISSCNCFRKQRIKEVCTTHELTKHPLYNVWSLIKRRCYKISSKNYSTYGQRGIKMDEEWKNDFESFYNWSINNGWEETLQIDRINNDGDYTPANCRWTTRKINCRNKRNNRWLEFNNEIKTLAEWAEIYNLDSYTISRRIDVSNMSIEEALTTPIIKYRRNWRSNTN